MGSFASRSALYPGWVMHERVCPRSHKFRYRVFAMLLDLEELPRLDRELKLFKWNRPGLFSFHDRDHGDGRPTRDWLDDLLGKAGIVAPGARRVLCYPRIFGYVFNPLSVWFCHDEHGVLKAMVYEVHNTYAERHSYVLPVIDEKAPDHGCRKDFYVSPFLSKDCRYHFRIHPPGKKVAVTIQEDEAGKKVLNASFTGKYRPLSDRTLLAMLFSYPLMTVKVVAAIHFEAVRLMLKGVRRHPHIPVGEGN
ncbi:MAG TPA: DUF1365 domain-containing protein [Rhizomicrobium sp.]|jgi:hypothetical protein|nr:DUF1365 domain-containing protein [Rhizomicrobium sp.]